MIYYIVFIAFVVIYFFINAIMDDKKQRKRNDEMHGFINKKQVHKKMTLEEFENDIGHLWMDGYLNPLKTPEEVLKYADELYAKLYPSGNGSEKST